MGKYSLFWSAALTNLAACSPASVSQQSVSQQQI